MNKKQKLVFQSKVEFAEGKPPKEIQILPTGKWDHPAYGVIAITPDDVREFKENFDKKIRKDIPITQGHESFDEKPAVGWFTKVFDRGDQGLWGQVDWNEDGKTALKQKAFKYFSPEFFQFYEDPESHEEYKNVLVGGALTNKPYFKELKSVVFSDKNIIKLSDKNNMDLKELLAKKVADLTDEEKTFINDHKDELSDEDKTALGDVLENDGDGGDGDGDGGDGDGDGDGGDGDGDGDGGDGDGDGGQNNASEPKQVMIGAAELEALKTQANQGASAFSDLNAMKIKTEMSKLMFSDQNKDGKILPKSEKKVLAFMTELNEKQRAAFCEIVNEMPKSSIFAEKGNTKGGDGTAKSDVDAKVKKMMSETKGLSYADAIRQLFSEDKELAKKYEQEIGG